MQINNSSALILADENPVKSEKKAENKSQLKGISGINIISSLEINTSTGSIPASISFENKKAENENLSDILDKILNAETEEEQFNLLSGTLLACGGKIDDAPENRNVVAFRTPNLPTENNRRGVYDDTTFVFWKEKDGTKKVKDFQSNTDPNGLFTDDRPNGDFGRIVAGKTYKFAFSYSQNYGKSLMSSEKLNIERFDPKENKFKPAKTSLDTDKTFLFHDGLESYNNTNSMGCQTFPRIYHSNNKSWNLEFNNFWETMRGDSPTRQKQIFYTILQLPEEVNSDE